MVFRNIVIDKYKRNKTHTSKACLNSLFPKLMLPSTSNFLKKSISFILCLVM